MASDMLCYQKMKVEKFQRTTRTAKSKTFKINFTFSLKTRYRHYRMLPHSRTLAEVIEGHPDDSESNAFAISRAVFLRAFPDDDVRKAVKRAVGGANISRGEMARLVERAVKEVREYCPEGEIRRYTVVDFDFEVLIKHSHVFLAEEAYDYPRMIPAADSAVEMLEKCDVGGGDRDEGERCCCICLEEFGGEEAARMPCKHVFHGGCIKEWLRTSHYCPLCRYEMPTAC